MLAAIVLCGVFAAPAVAQLAASSGTNDVYYSTVHSAPARVKDVVMERQDESGVSLMDRKRIFAQLADLVAEQVTVEGATEVAAAWHRGFTNGVEELRAAFANAPTNGMYLGVEMPYDSTAARERLDIYVASNHFDRASGYDLLWVHFNYSIPRPRIEVPYSWTGGVTRVVGSWTMPGTSANWTNVYTVTKGQYVYNNCRLLFVQRPTGLDGAVMNLKPHGLFGNPELGVSWGQVQTTYRGRASITGTLTDGTNDYVFANGQLMSTTPTEIPDENSN